MKKICLTLAIIYSSSSAVLAQQDPLYSQYLYNPLAINSAYSGLHPVLSVGLNTRFQWTGLEGSPETYTVSAHSSLVENKVGAGALIIRDKLGVTENTEVHLTYSYNIRSINNTFAFGLRTSLVNQQNDFSLLNLKVLDDPNFQPGSESVTKPNFGAGFIFMGNNLYLGLSVPRILNTEFSDGVNSSTRYRRHFYLQGAYLIKTISSVILKPGILLRGVENGPLSMDLSINAFLNNMVWAGLFTRDFNTVGIMGQLEFKNALKFGYSFELPASSNIETRFTTHELSLIMDFAILRDHDVLQRLF